MASTNEEDRVEALTEKSLFVNAADTTTVVPLPGIQTGPYFDSECVSKLRKGGFNVVALSNFFWLFDDFYNAVRRFGDFYEKLGTLGENIAAGLSYSQIEDAISKGKVVALVTSQNSMIIDNDIRLLRILHKLGLRVMSLTHQGRSLLGDGRGEKNPSGLSRFGELAIEEMNRLGILLDLSHASYKTTMDALEIAKEPPIISHACMLAKYFSKGKGEMTVAAARNISDEEAKAVAARGGVIGVMGIPIHLTDVGADGATVKDFGDHLEHLVNVAGIDHAGIGLEFSYKRMNEDFRMNAAKTLNQFGGQYGPLTEAVKGVTVEVGFRVKGLENYETIKQNVIRELVTRGFSDPEIQKVLGLNFMKVYERIFVHGNTE